MKPGILLYALNNALSTDSVELVEAILGGYKAVFEAPHGELISDEGVVYNGVPYGDPNDDGMAIDLHLEDLSVLSSINRYAYLRMMLDRLASNHPLLIPHPRSGEPRILPKPLDQLDPTSLKYLIWPNIVMAAKNAEEEAIADGYELSDIGYSPLENLYDPQRPPRA